MLCGFFTLILSWKQLVTKYTDVLQVRTLSNFHSESTQVQSDIHLTGVANFAGADLVSDPARRYSEFGIFAINLTLTFSSRELTS